MARPLRIEYDGAFYHVSARGNEQRKIYFTKTDYEKFKEYLKEALDKYEYLLHCFEGNKRDSPKSNKLL